MPTSPIKTASAAPRPPASPLSPDKRNRRLDRPCRSSHRARVSVPRRRTDISLLESPCTTEFLLLGRLGKEGDQPPSRNKSVSSRICRVPRITCSNYCRLAEVAGSAVRCQGVQTPSANHLLVISRAPLEASNSGSGRSLGPLWPAPDVKIAPITPASPTWQRLRPGNSACQRRQ